MGDTTVVGQGDPRPWDNKANRSLRFVGVNHFQQTFDVRRGAFQLVANSIE